MVRAWEDPQRLSDLAAAPPAGCPTSCWVARRTPTTMRRGRGWKRAPARAPLRALNVGASASAWSAQLIADFRRARGASLTRVEYNVISLVWGTNDQAEAKTVPLHYGLASTHVNSRPRRRAIVVLPRGAR